ncbi:hypothetical protein F0562_030055 [Nyssa sinensis]|uniref:Bulb-type lectin domain-containing protein n=1 Tax=Nyssa sinensis TaxID=561372 RepID=A0A5J5AZA5_9ASTE|nr:hypothetical protein F0562_030055 [Nyssa sinensis]
MRAGEHSESLNKKFRLQFFKDGVTNYGSYLVIQYMGPNAETRLNSEQPRMTNDTSATLDDFGNFVLREGDKILWQSSNDPTDTLLSGMKLGLFNLKSGKPQKQFLNSWISPDVPDACIFTLGVDLNNTKQLPLKTMRLMDQEGCFSFAKGNDVETDHSRRQAKLSWFRIGGSMLAMAVLTAISLLCCLKWKYRCFRGRSKGSINYNIRQDAFVR